MKALVTISFWAKKTRLVAGGLQPDSPVTIYCRITCGAKASKVELSTGLQTNYGNWVAANGRGYVTGKTPADKHINEQLTKMRDQLTDNWADLERRGKVVTPRAIARLYRNDGATLTLLELYEQFLAERKTLIGMEISEASYKVTVWRHRVLRNFLETKKLLDLQPDEYTHNMADRFIQWGLTERGYNRNNINKALQNVVQCLRWGVRRELLDKNPMELYKYKAAIAPEMKFLTIGELQQLTAHEMPTATLDRTRDCFVFQCWTGLAYADLAALDIAKQAHYHREKGTNTLRRVLHVTRAKSTMQQKYECIIPLLPEAERIIAKYEGELQVPTNQAYNRQLKEMGQVCGIAADKMTSHVGRKTAGTLMLNLGIRMETVSKFLGHSSVKMTEKLYAKILDTTVVDDFGKLFGAAPVMPPAPTTVYELPAPRPEPVPTRPARRIAVAASLPEPTSQNTQWRRPPPVTSHSPQKGAPAA